MTENKMLVILMFMLYMRSFSFCALVAREDNWLLNNINAMSIIMDRWNIYSLDENSCYRNCVFYWISLSKVFNDNGTNTVCARVVRKHHGQEILDIEVDSHSCLQDLFSKVKNYTGDRFCIKGEFEQMMCEGQFEEMTSCNCYSSNILDACRDYEDDIRHGL